VAKKQQPPPKVRPQLDCDPLEDDDQPPFTLDDDGNMVLRRSEKPPRKGAKRGKGKAKPGR
jgi:hypothetical protein